MSRTLFFTGFPGFLARNLTKQILKDYGDSIERIYLIVLEQERAKAKNEIARFPENEKFTILSGDITKENLGLPEEVLEELQSSITHLFHLAVIYDLAVPEDIAQLVNVDGTKHVTDWARKLLTLERYVYFSTAYVSGKREGRIYENELAMGQDFKNHYERTKFDAELMVENAKKDLSITIIRPGVVKGHSRTGETVKFDGLYFLLNMFDRLKYSPILPYLGDGRVEGNFVPADYVLEASSYLAFQDKSAGKTYHLTDPNPYKMRELFKMLAEAYLGRTPKGQIPLALAQFPMNIKGVETWLKVEKEALDYFKTDSSYDCTETVKDLAGSGISCPDLKETIEPMIEFYRRYKHDAEKHII